MTETDLDQRLRIAIGAVGDAAMAAEAGRAELRAKALHPGDPRRPTHRGALGVAAAMVVIGAAVALYVGRDGGTTLTTADSTPSPTTVSSTTSTGSSKSGGGDTTSTSDLDLFDYGQDYSPPSPDPDLDPTVGLPAPEAVVRLTSQSETADVAVIPGADCVSACEDMRRAVAEVVELAGLPVQEGPADLFPGIPATAIVAVFVSRDGLIVSRELITHPDAVDDERWAWLAAAASTIGANESIAVALPDGRPPAEVVGVDLGGVIRTYSVEDGSPGSEVASGPDLDRAWSVSAPERFAVAECCEPADRQIWLTGPGSLDRDQPSLDTNSLAPSHNGRWLLSASTTPSVWPSAQPSGEAPLATMAPGTAAPMAVTWLHSLWGVAALRGSGEERAVEIVTYNTEWAVTYRAILPAPAGAMDVACDSVGRVLVLVGPSPASLVRLFIGSRDVDTLVQLPAGDVLSFSVDPSAGTQALVHTEAGITIYDTETGEISRELIPLQLRAAEW